ncbi:hypothetical protein J9317_18980 [Metabacillus sp. KIGAM252]|uniref:DUF1232 domain-containing protein n=1 Tax=Metabacillus flavus TaxID=2823519 RepID=A0ABS5LJK9_9BACI|nr:hypothetical protein [Metabacillus flavus]MBS2970829.1 hypothetical protein [Metabacillus flavus]
MILIEGLVALIEDLVDLIEGLAVPMKVWRFSEVLPGLDPDQSGRIAFGIIADFLPLIADIDGIIADFLPIIADCQLIEH